MSYILCIETGTPTCSVAVTKGTEVLALRESHDNQSNHAQNLSGFIQDCLRQCDISAQDLGAVAVSKGPGSYTGLRIGVSTAKGICFGASIPLIAICSLEAMAYGILQKEQERISQGNDTLLCPMIDARRMEVYTQMFSTQPAAQSAIEAHIITTDSFTDKLANGKVLFFGNGAGKAKDVIKHPNAMFAEDFVTSAAYMAKPSTIALNSKNFVDTAYFEPFYLKDFVATKPKNKVLGSR